MASGISALIPSRAERALRMQQNQRSQTMTGDILAAR